MPFFSLSRIKDFTSSRISFFIVAVSLQFFSLQCSSEPPAQNLPEISPSEFSKLVTEMSEPSGFFPSDNWITNERTYLDVLNTIDEQKIEGGVYMGVASSQNFTYIARTRPDIAFFVDIRHQNRMQHYVYKIIFEMAGSRAEFLSYLLSKPIDSENPPENDITIDKLVEYFYAMPSSKNMRDKTTKRIISALQNKYHIVLDERDISSINYVMSSFHREHLNIHYKSGLRWKFPTYAEVLTTTDQNGEMTNAFNSNEDYAFLRKMQIENRIIPLTGNFGGNHAIKSVARFMEKHNLKLSAYYVSNVEEYVIRNKALWKNWVENIKSLPLSGKAVFIRWTHQFTDYSHKTRLQYIKDFLEVEGKGGYAFYNDLIYANYIRNIN